MYGNINGYGYDLNWNIFFILNVYNVLFEFFGLLVNIWILVFELFKKYGVKKKLML